MASMRTTKNVVTGFVVVAVCVACVLLIYHFTVGAKVSLQAPEASDAGGPAGSGASHAVPVPDEQAVTKPAEGKRPRPPGAGQGPSGGTQ
jgi:hypothetical protein